MATPISKRLMCSAYKNVDGTYVMVVINYANEEKEFSIDKEKVGNAQWQVYRTSDKEGGEFATGRKSEKWKDCSDSGTFYYNASELLIKTALFFFFFEENNTSMCPSIAVKSNRRA